MKNCFRLSIIFFCLLLTACVNNYAKFYKGMEDARTAPSYDPSPRDIKVFTTNDFGRDVKELVRKGFQPIGETSFNAGANSVSEAQLLEQARKVGAHVVLTSYQFTHSVSGAVPLTVPQNSTSYTTANATAYGAGGTVNAYGSGTTTTRGSQTVMMPYTVQRADFNAVYLVKTRARVGIFPVSLTDEDRKAMQSNAGIRVDVVTEGTTAYDADVLPDDIILAIGDDKVASLESYYKLLDKYEGRSPVFKISRNGQVLEKAIPIKSL